MVRVRDGLSSCIGCGCLSLRACPVYNPHDELSLEGPGARRWPAAARGADEAGARVAGPPGTHGPRT